MIKRISLLVVFVFLAFSCSDDDDKTILPSNFAGTLTINGVSTQIDKGFIIPPYTGDNPDYDKRRFYIALTDGNISVADNDLVYGSNVHQLVDFNLYTSTAAIGTVQNTTYSLYIPGSGFDMANPYIDHSGMNTNVVIQNGEFISSEEFSSDDMNIGQMTLSNTNGAYNISFSFSNDDDTISGTFTGTLTQLNMQYD